MRKLLGTYLELCHNMAQLCHEAHLAGNAAQGFGAAPCLLKFPVNKCCAGAEAGIFPLSIQVPAKEKTLDSLHKQVWEKYFRYKHRGLRSHSTAFFANQLVYKYAPQSNDVQYKRGKRTMAPEVSL